MSNGAMAFCGEGMKAGVQVGQTVGDPVEQNNANLRKALYYGYKGPGDCLTARYGADGAIGLTSELVSLANCGTCATSAYPALYNGLSIMSQIKFLGKLILSMCTKYIVVQIIYMAQTGKISTLNVKISVMACIAHMER